MDKIYPFLIKIQFFCWILEPPLQTQKNIPTNFSFKVAFLDTFEPKGSSLLKKKNEGSGFCGRLVELHFFLYITKNSLLKSIFS